MTLNRYKKRKYRKESQFKHVYIFLNKQLKQYINDITTKNHEKLTMSKWPTVARLQQNR